MKAGAALQSPLGQPVEGYLLRCGGEVRKRLHRQPCPLQLVTPFGLDSDGLLKHLGAQGWYGGLVSSKEGEAHMEGERLRVPGRAFIDPLCPSCTQALLKRLGAA